MIHTRGAIVTFEFAAPSPLRGFGHTEDVMLAEIFMLRLELAIRTLNATNKAANDQHISRATNIAHKVEEDIPASGLHSGFLAATPSAL